ncbi:hypothetical protein PMAC_000935 [Pneumocystis sp. 'macacae']|nr:hypothetical protein PMAC_000935 [Pneumocystis sp. 'macacae']
MTETFPIELKSIEPFIKRAEEIEDVDKLAFYYCSFWAVKLGLEMELKTKESEVYLGRVVDKLEQIRRDPIYQSKIQDDAASKEYMEKFAEKVFRNADEDVRMKHISPQTFKKFLAAVNFFEVMKIWGELNQDVSVGYIMNIYRSGKDPNYVLFNTKDDSESVSLGEKELLNTSEKTMDENDLSMSKGLSMLSFNGKEAILSTDDSLSLKSTGTFNVSEKKFEENKEISTKTSCISTSNIQIIEDRIDKIEKAQKHARWAISALNFEDLKTATHELKLALTLLESI